MVSEVSVQGSVALLLWVRQDFRAGSMRQGRAALLMAASKQTGPSTRLSPQEHAPKDHSLKPGTSSCIPTSFPQSIQPRLH